MPAMRIADGKPRAEARISRRFHFFVVCHIPGTMIASRDFAQLAQEFRFGMTRAEIQRKREGCTLIESEGALRCPVEDMGPIKSVTLAFRADQLWQMRVRLGAMGDFSKLEWLEASLLPYFRSLEPFLECGRVPFSLFSARERLLQATPRLGSFVMFSGRSKQFAAKVSSWFVQGKQMFSYELFWDYERAAETAASSEVPASEAASPRAASTAFVQDKLTFSRELSLTLEPATKTEPSHVYFRFIQGAFTFADQKYDSYGHVSNPALTHEPPYPRRNLFCEQIFGPVHPYRCACGKYDHRDLGIVCEKCGVEVIGGSPRVVRWGHIELPRPIVSPATGWSTMLVPVPPPHFRPLNLVEDDINVRLSKLMHAISWDRVAESTVAELMGLDERFGHNPIVMVMIPNKTTSLFQCLRHFMHLSGLEVQPQTPVVDLLQGKTLVRAHIKLFESSRSHVASSPDRKSALEAAQQRVRTFAATARQDRFRLHLPLAMTALCGAMGLFGLSPEVVAPNPEAFVSRD
jgi:hypothetical protein